MWPDFLRKYFGFNKQQGRGLFVLVLACMLIFIFRLLLPLFEPEREILIQNLPLLKMEHLKEDSSLSKGPGVQSQLLLFPFDPNQVTLDQLLELGLKRSSAKALVKFREKGFVFKEKRDLMKVYGIDQFLYNRLEPYLILPETPIQKSTETKSPIEANPLIRKEKTVRIELNSADSLALLSIPGIGPSFSKRILKYRSLLGGFYKPEQLMEVYGFTEDKYREIKSYVYVNPDLIQKLNLNLSDFKSLNRHPYLNYEHTKTIANARRKQKIDSLALQTLLNDESLYLQLKPYCAFD